MKINTLFDHKETIVIYKESMGHANDYPKLLEPPLKLEW
jgi:hypothetical protein